MAGLKSPDIYISLPRYTVLLRMERREDGKVCVKEAPPIAQWTVGKTQRAVLMYYRRQEGARIKYVR